MAYVVTQSCCADASCVVACPVNCIHPAPGEEGFATAEMLYVDPRACVGCGACATACPVDAIKPAATLTPDERPFVALNADYYDCFPHHDRTPLAPVAPQRRLTRPGPVRVAVVGAGPAGLYAADELLRHPGMSVDVYDRLLTPYGLVRHGVAPDHPHTKRVETLFRAIEEQPGFRYALGVDVGRDVTHADLARRYHAVVHAGGASADRRLGVEGEDLPGSLAATDLVAWYNGHPERQGLPVPLHHERAVVVGNGNVALDVARMLALDPADLERTDVAALPWAALARSRVREVVVLGRRGPADAAFTLPELVGLTALVDAGRLTVRLDTGGDPLPDGLPAYVATLAHRPPSPGARTIVLRFRTTPVRIVGDTTVSGVEVERDGVRETIEAGLVVRAIGYHGRPVPGLPHDPVTGTVTNDGGRVRPGLYVAGWAKRGPSGFIGTNKACAQQTVESLLDDLDDGLPDPTEPADLPPGAVGLAGWRALDGEERRRGQARGRPRAKVVDPDEQRRLARAAAPPRPRRGYPAVRRLLARR
ncbi:FAD-dependent oxidoreductase [Nocardioides marinquilinus]|uniref:ferredoxin--NADP(+) reductase n=1 Tax=Nocardioides marinquilinus TaxID=1210400 RepID=A0ABP9PW19_9ACTN